MALLSESLLCIHALHGTEETRSGSRCMADRLEGAHDPAPWRHSVIPSLSVSGWGLWFAPHPQNMAEVVTCVLNSLSRPHGGQQSLGRALQVDSAR